MRRFGLFFAALLVAFIAKADPITLKSASKLALPYMENQLKEPVLVKKATRHAKKKLSATYEATSPYYIYSRGEGRGFVIVSGDDALPEVLGYTESGDFDENDLPPFLVWYLDYYGNLIEAAQQVGAGRMETPKYATNRIDVAPLIETHWHQSTPYNNMCPTLKTGGRTITGCVATAAAQVLYYWRKDLPAYTQAATSSYTQGDANATTAFPKGTELKWDLMRTEYGTEPAEYRDAVATLMAVVGGAAKLTYGSSTSGYTQDCCDVFKNYFKMNGGTCYVKDYGQDGDNYTDAAWSTLLYNELVKKHPIEYSGCDANGSGHAVVVDGYQASTDYFHFNLGWGNPSAYDGYFTVARGKSPSWGFNNSWQEAIIGAYPLVQNLKASVIIPKPMYKNRTSVVKVKVENHGTLPYSGIYVHLNTTGKKPTSLGSAKASDKETELSNDGQEYILPMEIKPTSDKVYLFVTDNKLNVLATATIDSEQPEDDLWFKGIKICGSSDKQDEFTIVYNEKTSAEATFINKKDIAYEGSLKIALYGSSDGGENFKFLSTKTAKLQIEGNSEATTTFSLVNTSGCPIKVDSLYKVVMQLVTSNDQVPISIEEGTDTIASFILKGGDMEVVGFEDKCLTFKGRWDPLSFASFVKKTAYKTACSYDLTQVTSIDEVPAITINPNALIYVSDKNAKGVNVVCGGVCNELSILPGYDFTPREAFKANNAAMSISQTPNKWYLLTTPCDLDVPAGMLARNINAHTSSGINNKTTNVNLLEAGKTYLITTTSTDNQILTGKNSNVVSTPIENTDTALIGTFINTTTPQGAFLVNMDETQMFQPVDEGSEVEALRGYFIPSNIKKEFKAMASVVYDPTYQKLGIAIQNAYTSRDLFKDIVFDYAYRQLTDSIIKAEEVYSKMEATNPAVKQQTTNLTNTVEWYKLQILDPSITAIDYTSYITNPSFETGKITGWTVEEANYTSIRQTSNINYKGVGADGNYLLYNIKSGELTGCGISQTIHGLPAGYYSLRAMLGSSKNKQITMFANDSTTTVESHPFGQYYLTEACIDNIYVGHGDSLTIGIKAGSWYKADDFRLYYTATDPTAIDDIEISGSTTNLNNQIYDLTGRVITPNSTYTGVYIQNGKKYLKR